jgi:ADP-ribose pyrophosphatase YjhB (NUDIX family)
MINARQIRHCRACGTPTTYVVPPEDNRERAVCPACGTVHYENPLNVVGTVPVFEGKVLLCLRNIEPRKGFWTLPAGFMELGESTVQGALRETLEEAGADIALGPLFTLLNVPHVGQVHL